MKRLLAFLIIVVFTAGCTLVAPIAGIVTGPMDCGAPAAERLFAPGTLAPHRMQYALAVVTSPAVGIVLGAIKGAITDAAIIYDGYDAVNVRMPFHPCTPMLVHDYGNRLDQGSLLP